MAEADAWLTTLLGLGEDVEPPHSPRIPVDYLRKPRRQQLASQQNLSFPPVEKKRKPLANIEPPNEPYPRKRRTSGSRFTMSQALREPLSSRAGRRRDGSPPPQSIVRRSGRKPALPPMLDETSTPTLTPSASDGDSYADFRDRPESSSSVTGSTASKVRSRSPTKRMVDLRVAEKKVVPRTVKSPADVPDNVRGLYKAIQSLARVPRGVIPRGIEDEIKLDAGGDFDDLDLLIATKANGVTTEQLRDEFKAVRGIRDATAFCKTNHVHEPTWNERVHSRMIEQALCTYSGLEYHNITTARVLKELVPGNKYGELLRNKMIDYAIILEPPLFSKDEVITRLAASLRPLQRTINPSDYSPLCHSPVVIGIETKSAEGSKENGEVQLSIWATAYFNRLRTLTQDPVLITLPLILISDGHWRLFLARDLDDSIEIIDAVDFGDTGDIVGCYKILAVLRLLCDWARTTFLQWFAHEVLQPE